MKQSLLSFIVAAGFLAAGSTPVLAEAPRIEHVIDLLHKAKDSDKPLPLLEQAHAALKKFDPKPSGLKATAAGIGARHQAANELAAVEHKKKAMAALNEAIDTAKSGGDAKPKIDHAIALAHEAGNLKH